MRRWDRPSARACSTTAPRSRPAKAFAWPSSRKVSAVTGTTPPRAVAVIRSRTIRSYGVSPSVPCAAARTCTVVRIGSSPGWRSSTYPRAARSSRVDSAASSVISQPLLSRLTTAGGSSPPNSWDGTASGTGRALVASRTRPNSPNHRASTAAQAAIATKVDACTWSEPDSDVGPGRRLDLVVRLRPEPGRSGDERRRHGLRRGVVGLHRVVVELPRVADPVLGVGQLGLQGEEVLVGLELRVRLGEGEQPAERLGEYALGGGLAAGAVPGAGDGVVTGGDDGFERAALVRGVPAHRLDQVGDQRVAALELDVDLRPRGADLGAQPDEPVVRGDRPDHDGDDEQQDDEAGGE